MGKRTSADVIHCLLASVLLRSLRQFICVFVIRFRLIIDRCLNFKYSVIIFRIQASELISILLKRPVVS